MEHFEVLEDNLSAKVLSHSHLVSVELITTQLIESGVAAEARVFIFDFAHNVTHGLALMKLLVISAHNGVENCPHDLWQVDLTLMIPDVQTEDDLVKFAFVYIETTIAKRCRQSANEFDKPASRHIVLSTFIELLPCNEERCDIAFLQRKHLKSAFDLMHILEFLIDDRDEDVQEYEESCQLERHPVEVRNAASLFYAVVHDHVPTLTCG